MTPPQKFDLVDGSYICRICGKSLSSPKLAQRHVNSKHKKTDNGQVEETPKTLPSSPSSSLALSTTLASLFVCPLCEKTFKNGSALKRHLKSAHSSEVKNDDAPPEFSKTVEKTSNGDGDAVEATVTPATISTSTTVDEPSSEGLVSLAKINLGVEMEDGAEDAEDPDDDGIDKSNHDEVYMDEEDGEEEDDEDDAEDDLEEEGENVLDENSGALVPSSE